MVFPRTFLKRCADFNSYTHGCHEEKKNQSGGVYEWFAVI